MPIYIVFLISYNLRQWSIIRTRGESEVLGGEGLEGANRKKKIGGKIKKLEKNRNNNFNWKWYEKHWELQEIP